MKNLRSAAVALSASVMALWSQTLLAGEAVDEQAPADPDGQVVVINTAGSVDVSGWDKDEVHVTGTLGDGVDRLDFIPEGKRTTVRVVLPEGSHRDVGSTRLEIHIPAGSALTVNAVSADIDVRDVRGVQRLETVSGDVDAKAAGSDVEAKTVSGDVTVNGPGDGSTSLVTVTTVSGDADVSGFSGEVEVTAVSGDLKVSAGTVSRARVKTTSGDIDFRSALAADSRLEVETINGDVGVMVADAADVDVDVETFNGDIENCFDEQVERQSKYGPGRFLRFSRGAGNRKVEIQTLNGDVELCDR